MWAESAALSTRFAWILRVRALPSEVVSRGVEYRVGAEVRPDSYDDDPRVECTNGIHFFLTRAETEEY